MSGGTEILKKRKGDKKVDVAEDHPVPPQKNRKLIAVIEATDAEVERPSSNERSGESEDEIIVDWNADGKIRTNCHSDSEDFVSRIEREGKRSLEKRGRSHAEEILGKLDPVETPPLASSEREPKSEEDEREEGEKGRSPVGIQKWHPRTTKQFIKLR